MPPLTDAINDVAKAIQLALGPVFLLTGIAGMLNVMTGRLSRIIDRGRYLTERMGTGPYFSPEGLEGELKSLEIRRHITSRAITMCTISALFICLVILVLFLEVMLKVQLNWIVAMLFMLATLALVFGLSFFLREVHMASRSVRIPFSRKQ